MLRSYLKMALRNLSKNKVFAAINIAGLAVGLACCFLILLYIQNELGYDRYHARLDRIHRVALDYATDGAVREEGSTQGILAPVLQADFPEITHAVRFLETSRVFRNGDVRFREHGLFLTDPAVFDVFSYDLLQGETATALAEPFSIVLTTTLAQKYFGRENPLGKTLRVDGTYDLRVTGVMAPVPRQSHFTFDALISMSSIEAQAPEWMFRNWLATTVQTFILLAENADADFLRAKLPDFMERHAGDLMRSANRWVTLHVEPLKDIYLHSKRGGPGARGSFARLFIFGIIALFVLCIACINFMNLNTARATDRAKEIGLRKVIGARRQQLAVQILGESMFTSSLAFLIALGLCELLLPAFNTLAATSLTLAPFSSQMLVFAGAATAAGLLAGSYPAIVLSSLRPAQTLAGPFRASAHGLLLRKTLVVLQFGISIALVAATAIVYQQLAHLRASDLGFDRHRILTLALPGNSAMQDGSGGEEGVRHPVERLKHELGQVMGVLGVAASQTAPAGGLPQAGGAIENHAGSPVDMSVGLYMVDFDFIELYGIEVVAGRSFSRDIATDSTAALLVNETACRKAGFLSPEEAVGRRAGFWGREGTIIGVVKDFHHYSLHRAVEPMALRIDPENWSQISLRLAPGDPRPVLQGLQARWKSVAPDWPFDYGFVDARFDRQYRSDNQFGQIFRASAALAIFIACLGLAGLSAYTVQQRTKEIGVRKVLGASAMEIILLLSGSYAKLIGIALVIASPLTYFAMTKWLQGFAYRTSVDVSVFLLSGALTLLIAMAVIGVQAKRAASANPVHALRHE